MTLSSTLFIFWVKVKVLVAQLCPILCDLMDCSPPVFSVLEIFQARILEWVAIPFSRESSQPRDWTQVSCIAGRFFTIGATSEAQIIQVKMLVTQSCLTLCDPMDCSPPVFSVLEIFQARILEWVAIPFSRGSSWPRYQTWVSHTAGRFFTIWATKQNKFSL